MTRATLTLAALLLAACANAGSPDAGNPAAPPLEAGQKEAIFAMGCFWCVEKPFDDVPGVLSTTSGYTGGSSEHPTYAQVSSGRSGHYEAIRVVYDPTKTDYDKLLDVFWHNINPLQSDGQFCDRGDQYRTAVFTSDAAEEKAYHRTREEVEAFFQDPVATKLLPESTFWVAEDYHQDYYKTSPGSYNRYKWGCGRPQKLKELWGDEAGGQH